jgi:hypothetical protein
MSTIQEPGAFPARPAVDGTTGPAAGPAEGMVRVRAVAPGLIANSLVRVAVLQAGESLLVIGAADDVGVFVVGRAAAAGADVLATASDADGVDAVIDLVHTGTRLAAGTRAMRSGARLVSPLNGPDAAAWGP